MTTDFFADEVAERYDVTHAPMFRPDVVEPCVSFLAGLASDGPALEFGIGTGRIALPLADRGVAVSGIELSPAMARQLRAKHGGDAIDITIGDFASTSVGSRFALVYLVFNTIMNLTTQEEQVRCFANAVAHLRPGGCFVVEAMMPQLRRLPPGEKWVTFEYGPNALGIDEYHVASQRLVSHHLTMDGDRGVRRSVPFRYVWPSELDLMARMANLTFKGRYADWDRAPFTDESRSHVSVWRAPAP